MWRDVDTCERCISRDVCRGTLPPGCDLASIEDRTAIRKAVQNGNVEEAIERVNDLNPEVRARLGDPVPGVALFASLCYVRADGDDDDIPLP